MKENYIFASTYLRTIEKHLLDKTDIERMIGAKGAAQVLSVLENTNYAKEFKESISKIPLEEYREVLKTDIREAEKLLYFLTENKSLIKLILNFFDFHNLKVLFKEKFLGNDFKEFLSTHGSQKPGELRKVIIEDQKAAIDQDFLEIIKEAKKIFKKNSDSGYIDFYLDKKNWEFSLKLIKGLKSDFLVNFWKKEIDILNLKTSLRCYYLEKIDLFEEYFIEGGNIRIDFFLRVAQVLEKKVELRDLQNALSLLKPYCEKSLKEILESKELETEVSPENYLSKLFKKLEEWELKELKKAKFIATGPEAIISYFFIKFNANRNVRIILEGKLNDLENEEILERVRM